MTAHDEFGVELLQRLLDEREIRSCLQQYCRAADRLDYGLLRSVYHPDATDHHGVYDGDVEGFLSWFEQRHRNVMMSMHIIANSLIEFTSATEAVVETYCVTIQRVRVPGAASGVLSETRVLCRYIDILQCRDGRSWKIATRTVVYDSANSRAVQGDLDLPAEALTQCHGIDDPGYALVVALTQEA